MVAKIISNINRPEIVKHAVTVKYNTNDALIYFVHISNEVQAAMKLNIYSL
jgi:hypothetical protein